MQNKLFDIITALLIMLLAGSAMCATYDSNVTLVEKDAGWQPVPIGASALVEYNSAGSEFEYSIVGEGLEPCVCYKLIYYADKPDRFNATQWGGNNPGAIIASVCANESGYISDEDSIELGINMPDPADWNIDPCPDYCDNHNGKGDYYDDCCGAKLWLVNYNDYDESESKVINWGNHTNWLFEDNLIWYDDTDESYTNEIVWTGNDADEYTAGDEPGVAISAIVRDSDGECDLVGTTVTANFSQHGIDGLVDMEFVEMINCTHAMFESDPVVITQSTCTIVEDMRTYCYRYGCYERCYGFILECEEVDVEIVTIDDNATTNFEVGADEPHSLEVTGPESKFRFPELPVWTHNMEQKMCRWDDHDWWSRSGWADCRDFMSYVAYLDVWIYDQYGNPVDNDVCYRNLYVTNNGTPVAVQSSHCEWDRDEDPNDCRNKIWAVDLLPETVKFTVHYSEDPYHEGSEASSVAPGSCIVTFLPYVDDLVVTVEDTLVFADCALTANVSAQLVDEPGNALAIEGVPVMFSTSNQNVAVANPQWAFTDENGIARTDLCAGYITGTVSVYAASECCTSAETGELEVVEGPDSVSVMIDAEYMVTNDSCDDPDTTTVTVQILNDSDMPFMVGGLNVTTKILYDSNDCEDEGAVDYHETDENGSVEIDLAGTSEECRILVCVEMVACGIRDSMGIDVVTATLDALSMDVETVMNPGDMQSVEVTGLNTSRNMVMCLECDLEFDVENDTVVSWDIGDKNNLTANAIGVTTVNATCNGLSTGDIGITVEDPTPVCTAVTISPAGPFGIYIGNAITFSVSCIDQYGDEIECSELEWHSDNETVGEVIGGIFEGYATGVANVTATGCGVSNPVRVNVTAAPIPDPTPTPTYRRSSGGSGGTYPSNWDLPKNVTTGSSNNTTSPDDKVSIPTPIPTMPESPTRPNTSTNNLLNETEDECPESPGFTGIVLVGALLIAIGIVAIMARRKER